LTFAVEQAWLSGIVVVVSAGNGGASLGHLTDPAIDPYVIAVGADDYHGSTSTTDDTIPSFSGLGDGARSPDLVAPGVHVQSLRDPGSYVDQTYGATGLINYRFFRGSGTSQAAAVVSGSAALLIQEHPAWTPDQIKDALVDTATPLPGVSSEAQGAGLINLQAASEFTGPGSQTFPLAAGTGTLEGSRGGAHLVLNGVALQGEEDIFGQPVNTAALAAQEVAQAAWNGGTWNGSAWSASSWLLSSWLGPLWPSIPWSGDSWSGVAWAAEDYESGNWSGSSWSGSSWSGSSWSGSSWSGSSWSGSSWSGSSWSGSSWSGSSWSEASWSVASWS
jgi:serine protease AprX